ncbi:TonB-linked outer membrane protein, SusC/RagA family [Chryseolinea serpens]|uniref:TonB-linked outer membrane protein, SusC/RagA family n=1 Tax=Chryseolinea serpens TaxID=947013 RepID=A0A1M5X1M0_9BACT|nr:TonB-dependent receptor [Chryseolinea serpens]SHH93630.1 TonB-linked outer membrane protein, SusC/RagA family [Chryseolinea serpens]
MRKFLLICFTAVFAFAFSESQAQERTVTGRVTSKEDGSGLPGVNVVIKGTTNGTVTDANGNYSLSVPGPDAVITFTFIGLLTQETALAGRSSVDVQMEQDVTQLTEIVVVGYGTQDKRTLTSSISSVKGEDIALMPVASFDQALNGKASGVQVSVGSGLLGQAPRIRIRGTNSITSGADPLVVIDGVPMLDGNPSGVAESNALGDINPSDIESYQVLKDGAATAIYGSRGANGVILITTKSGKAGKVKINYDFQAGVNSTARRFKMLDADQFIAISNEKFATSGQFTPQALPGPNNVNTDWQDVIFRNGAFQNHNLNISGGSDQVSYYFSGGYMKQDGAIVNNSLDRYTMRANIDYHGVEWLSAGMKLAVTRQVNNGLNTGNSALSGNVAGALAAFPNVPVYDANNPLGYNISPDNTKLGRGNNLQDIASGYTNVKYVLDHNKQEADNYRVLSNGYLQANLMEGLNIKTQLGVDILDNSDFLTWDPFHGDGGGSSKGILYRASNRNLRWNWQNTINFKRTIAENHNIAVTVGNEFQKTTFRSFYGQGTTFSDPSFLKYDLITGTFNKQESGGDYYETGFSSYFGRLNYDFKSKYLLSFSVRNDAISSLPKANRQGTFFAGSVGWDVARESFFNIEGISQLKVRGSWAQVGNTSIDPFSYVGIYGPQLYGSQSGLAFSQAGNSSLQWEQSEKLDVGADIGLLNNRLSVGLDYYQNDISKMILDAPTSPAAGIPNNTISKNIGEMVNKGFEVTISSDNLKGRSLTWNTTLTLTSNKNKINALVNGKDIVDTYTINRVGQPISAIYGFSYAGVNPANGNPLYNVVRGGQNVVIQGNIDDASYYLYNAASPSEVSQKTDALSANTDKVILGNPAPKVYGGLSNSLKWKNFDFDLLLTYSAGNKIMNVTRQSNLDMVFRNNSTEILDRWTLNHTNTDVPRLSYNNGNFVNQTGNSISRFVENGDFIRVQNISLGYSLPKNVLSSFAKGAISNVRIYAQVRNAYVFTKYKGADPELNYVTNGDTKVNSRAGVDYNTNPLMRTVTFGLSVGL